MGIVKQLRAGVMRPSWRGLLGAWCILTLMALCTPAQTVRQASGSVNAAGFVHAREQTVVVCAFNNGLYWHAALFFGMGLLAGAGLPPRRRHLPQAWAGLLAGLTGFSVATELIQEWFIPGRAFSWRDLAANEVGLLAGLLLGGLLAMARDRGWRFSRRRSIVGPYLTEPAQ